MGEGEKRRNGFAALDRLGGGSVLLDFRFDAGLSHFNVVLGNDFSYIFRLGFE